MAPEVIGRLKALEFSFEKIEDLNQHLKEDDEIEAKIISINHKDRIINLSIRSKDETQEPKNRKKSKQETTTNETIVNPTLGDLLKEQLENQEEEEEDEEDSEEE